MEHRIRRILEDLEAVRENLLALSDDIWLSIDHNDSEGLEEGVQFKRAYNEKMAAFDSLASELSSMVQQFTAVRLESHEQSGLASESENVRIVQELNREEPHSIAEDFIYKRPHGFILDGQGTTGITMHGRGITRGRRRDEHAGAEREEVRQLVRSRRGRAPVLDGRGG